MVLTAFVFTSIAAAAHEPATLEPAVSGAELTPGESLRTVMMRRYTMSGRIRPLLFWYGRDNIGLARVVWRRGDNGARGYELLVGTDPARAPRSLNRWGYISEEVRGSEGATLALMTRADDVSYEDAAASATQGSNASDFRALRSRIQNGSAVWQIANIRSPGALTVHDLDAALERVRDQTATNAPNKTRIPARARPGFLVALAELLDRSGQRPRDRLESDDPNVSRILYVFGQNIYELQLRESHPDMVMLGGHAMRVVRSSFEIRTLSTGSRTRFEVTSGTEGALTRVPIAVEWQPRWWLKIELRLDPSQFDG